MCTGTTAVVSLMLGSLLDSAFPADSLGGALQSGAVRSAQSGFSELDVRKIELVTAITLVSGLIMVRLLYIFKILGFQKVTFHLLYFL